MQTNQVIQALLTLILAVISAYVIPWIKSRVNQEKLDKIQQYAEYAVRYAEQVYSTEQFKEKKEYVFNYILDKVNTIGIKMNEKDVDILVEGIVNLVKKG